MKDRPPSHLSDDQLDRGMAEVTARWRAQRAMLLAHIAEADTRRMYLEEGFPTMEAFCVGGLHVDEDEVDALVGAARTAREYPEIFEAIADGRLHVEAVMLLRPHLTRDNAADLLGAATHKSESEIERLLAERRHRAR